MIHYNLTAGAGISISKNMGPPKEVVISSIVPGVGVIVSVDNGSMIWGQIIELDIKYQFVSTITYRLNIFVNGVNYSALYTPPSSATTEFMYLTVGMGQAAAGVPYSLNITTDPYAWSTLLEQTGLTGNKSGDFRMAIGDAPVDDGVSQVIVKGGGVITVNASAIATSTLISGNFTQGQTLYFNLVSYKIVNGVKVYNGGKFGGGAQSFTSLLKGLRFNWSATSGASGYAIIVQYTGTGLNWYKDIGNVLTYDVADNSFTGWTSWSGWTLPTPQSPFTYYAADFQGEIKGTDATFSGDGAFATLRISDDLYADNIYNNNAFGTDLVLNLNSRQIISQDGVSPSATWGNPYGWVEFPLGIGNAQNMGTKVIDTEQMRLYSPWGGGSPALTWDTPFAGIMIPNSIYTYNGMDYVQTMSFIDATGNVVIGPTSDNAADKLQVYGTAAFGTNTADPSYGTIKATSSTGGYVFTGYDAYANNQLFWLGSDLPTYATRSIIFGVVNDGGAQVAGPSSGNYMWSWGLPLVFQSYDSAGIDFWQGGSGGRYDMRITSGGNVLIGTAAEDGINKLQVNGSEAIYGSTLSMLGTYAYQDYLPTGNISAWGFGRRTSDGYIPNYCDKAFQLTWVGGTSSDGYLELSQWNGSDGSLAGIPFKVSSAGNVLIGTTTDDTFSKLQVNGTISGNQFGYPGDSTYPLATYEDNGYGSYYWKLHAFNYSIFGMGVVINNNGDMQDTSDVLMIDRGGSYPRSLVANDGATVMALWSNSMSTGIYFPQGIASYNDGYKCIDTEYRTLHDSAGSNCMDWSSTLGIMFGNVLIDGAYATSIDVGARLLYGNDGSSVMMDWSDAGTGLVSFTMGLKANIYDTSDLISIDPSGRGLLGFDGESYAITWGNDFITLWQTVTDGESNSASFMTRVLYASDGSTPAINWSDASAVSLPSYTTAGVLTNDTGGNIVSVAPVADGTYTVGSPITPVTGNAGTITITNGVITAVQQAT